MTDKISQDKYVSLTYTISDENNEILERVDSPINYIQGRDDHVIEKIEKKLEGCKKDDEVSIALSPEEGFGAYQEELTFTDDIENVPTQFHKIGAEVEFQNDHGEAKTFLVTKIENGKLTVDGNHPFAGKTVIYTITVNEVRDATPEELSNVVTNMPYLH